MATDTQSTPAVGDRRERFDAALAAFDSMRIASHALTRAGSAASGLALSDLRALVVVQRQTGIKPSVLAAALNLTPGGMTAVIDRLVAAGALRRHADPDDRRSQRLKVTVRGEDALEMVRGDYVEVFESLFADDELAGLAECFGRMAARFQSVTAQRVSESSHPAP